MGRLTTVLLVPLLGTTFVSASDDPSVVETWLGIEAGDVRYGYCHTRVDRSADGRVRYTVETRTRVNPFGMEPQETRQSIRCEVTSDFHLLSFDCTTEMASGTYRIEGRAEDGALLITEHGGARRSERSVTFADRPIPNVCIVDWLRANRNRTPNTAVTFDTPTGQLDRVTLTRRSSDASRELWEIAHEQGDLRGTIELDAHGELREIRYKTPHVRLIRRPAAEARQITCRTLTGREVLVFPIETALPPADRLTQLTTRLTWRDIPRAQFELIGWQQVVSKHSQKDGNHQAIVQLRTRPLPTIVTDRPSVEPAMARWLAETEYLKPGDPAIRAVVKQVVPSQQGPLAASRTLAEWVHKNIEGRMIAETLSGPEVLERKVGKCTEYATLFGSLARAAGIPTRIALGLHLSGNQWMGHMWNEVYVGEWLPVDASDNRIGGDCRLLKLIHSDTVAGTQALRWALTESLEVEVVSFQRSPAPLANIYTTGIVGNVYTNAEYACRLRCPHEGWHLEQKDTPGVAMIQLAIPGYDAVQIHFVSFPLPEPTSPDALLELRLALFKQRYDAFTLRTSESRTVADRPGHMIRFDRAARAGESGTMRTTEFAWRHETNGYLLNIIAPLDQHDAHIADVEALLEHFEPLSAPG